MKKLFLTLILFFFNISITFGAITIIETKKLKPTAGLGKEIMRFKIETICVDGYKFVLARSNTEKAGGRALTQFFEEKDGKSLPAKC